jgi:hypothetical protein
MGQQQQGGETDEQIESNGGEQPNHQQPDSLANGSQCQAAQGNPHQSAACAVDLRGPVWPITLQQKGQDRKR